MQLKLMCLHSLMFFYITDFVSPLSEYVKESYISNIALLNKDTGLDQHECGGNDDRVNHTFNSMLLKYFINNAYIMSAVNRSTEMFTETDEHMEGCMCHAFRFNDPWLNITRWLFI